MPDQDNPYIVSKGIDFLKKVAKTNGIDEGVAESYLKKSNGNYSDAMDIMLEENGFNPYDDQVKKQIHEKEQLPVLSSEYIFKNRLTDEEQKKLEQQSNTLFEKISKGRGIEERVGNFGGGVVLEERKYDDKDKARFKAELNEINDRLRRDDELRTLLPKVIKPEESILGRKGYRRLKQEASKEVSFEPGIGLGRRDYDPNTQALLLKEQEAEKARRVAEEKKELDKEYLADPVAISANTAAVTAKAMGNDPVSALYASNKIMDDNAAKLLRQQAMAAEKYKAEPTEENAARLDEINLHIDAQAKEIAKGDRIGKALQVYSQKKAIEAELKAEEQGFVGDALTYSKNVALGVRDRISNGLDDIFSSRNDSFDEHQAKRAERGIAEADRIQQSALRGGLRERYVEVDGQKLVVDDIGDVMYGVDDKFRPTDKDLSSFINKYEANPENYEQKTDYSLSRLMGTSIQVMADMVPIIVANGGIAAATAALPGGQAKALRTVGSIFTSGVSMFSDNLKKNLELGKGFNYAWNTAMGTTLVQALIEQAGGFEARAGGALGDAAKKALTSKLDNLISSYAGKSLAKTDLVKKAQDILKDYIGEGAEETMQSITGHASDYLFYGEDMNVDWNEEFNTWASLPLSIGGIKAITGAMQNRSDKLMMRRGYNAALSNPAGHNEILDGLVSEKKISEKEARIKKDVLAKSKPDYDAINSDAYDHISEKDKARLVSLMADRDMNRMMADYIEVGPGKATYTKKAEDLDKKFQELWKELDEKGVNEGKRGHGDVRGINFFDNVNQEENEKYERQETGGADGNSQGTADGERQGSQEKSEGSTEGTDRRDFGGAAEGTISILTKEAENGKPSDKSEGVQGNEAPTDGEGRSTAGEQGTTAKDQGRAEQAPVSEAVPTRKQVPVLAEVTRKVRLREKLTEAEERVRPLAELWERVEKLNDSISDIKFRDSRDPSASYIDSNGNEGVINVDEGGKAEFVYNGGVRELGNVSGGITAAMREAGISEQGKIIPQGDNKYSIDGVYYENRLSKPEAAISYDEKGNISVELDTVQGGYNNMAPVTVSKKFTGPQAEELAYQIHLEKIIKDEKGFIEYLRRRDDGRLPKASEETTNRNNEGVRAAEEKQEAGGERLTEREIQEKRLAKKSDIERRRQEEFDNVASQRVIKVEDYESTNDEGETTYIQVRHYANGSRKIFFNIEKNKYGNTNDNSPNSIAKEQSTEDALKYNFDESTFGKPKKVGERTAKEASLDSHDRKINAKYDAELAALEQSKDDFIEKRLEELTVSGLTEEERQREIAIRAKLTKMSPYEKGMNELWALVDRYTEMPNGARGKNTANGQTLWSSILTKAKELGIQATRSQNNVSLKKKNKGGEWKRVAKSKNYKEYNYKALSPNEDKALLSRRSKSVKEIFLKLYYGLESSSVKIEYGVQLSDNQKEIAFDDVANGIPSNGAEAVLNTIAEFVNDGAILVYDPSLGSARIPFEDFFQLDNVNEIEYTKEEEQKMSDDIAAYEKSDAYKKYVEDVLEEELLISESVYEYKKEGNVEEVYYSSISNGNYPGSNSISEESTVIGIWNKFKNIQFSGSTKVKSAKDVAHIMRLLEDKSVEHAFAVHVDKNGQSHIQFLSIGGTSGTVVDGKLVLSGIQRFGSKKVYLVHNHPSGNTNPSNADVQITKRISTGLGFLGVEFEHIIMDTYKQEYTVLDSYGNKEGVFVRKGDNNKEVKLTTHVFDGLKVLSEPIGNIRSSYDASAILYNKRFSVLPKNGMLVLNSNNAVIGNYVFKDEIDEKELLYSFSKYPGGKALILYSNQDKYDTIKGLSAKLANIEITLLDHIFIKGGGVDVRGAYEYISAADEGYISDIESKYGTNAKPKGEGSKDNPSFQSNNKKFAKIEMPVFKDLLKNLNKAIPGVFGGVFSGKDFEKRLIEETGIKMYDKKGIIYGFVGLDGKVYLNGDNINANTPVHEYGHVFINILKKKFPDVYKRGLNLADKSPYLDLLLRQGSKSDYATLIKMYRNGDKTALQEEALAMAIGDKGERMVQSSMFKDFNGWVEKMWAAIKRLFGNKLTDMTPDQLNKLTFKQFSSLVAGQLVAGEAVGERVEVRDIRFQVLPDGRKVQVRALPEGVDVVNGFYSPLEKILAETKADKMPVKQWIEKFGKGEEAKWTGLTDWLNQQQGSVSKKDIQQYLKDNRIEVVEVVKGKGDKEWSDKWAESENLGQIIYENGSGIDIVKEGGEYLIGYNNQLEKTATSLSEAKRIAKDIYDKEGDRGQTKFSQYQLEGEKENYKEVLVTLPKNELQKDIDRINKTISEKENNLLIVFQPIDKRSNELYGKKYSQLDYNEKMEVEFSFFKEGNKKPFQDLKNAQNELSEAKDEYFKLNKDKDILFQSSHFDEKNILVHIRHNTRTDADGNKVLFLEEIQSDFSAAYRKSQEEVMNFISKNEEEVIELYKKRGKLEVEC